MWPSFVHSFWSSKKRNEFFIRNIFLDIIFQGDTRKDNVQQHHHHHHHHKKPHGQKQLIKSEDYSEFDIVKATQYGAIERCKEIIEGGFDVNQRDNENVTLLHWAAINNRCDIVKYYIAKGADVNAVGGDLNSTPLHWATRQGHIQMVIMLMQHRADPSILDGEGTTESD